MIEAVNLLAADAGTPELHPAWGWVGGPAVGIALLSGVFALIKSVLDKKVKPVDAVQSQTQVLLDGLESMVTLLTEDKAKDTERISRYETRIEELESAALGDFELMKQLHSDLHDLRNEMRRKDHLIEVLVTELDALGVVVGGLDFAPQNISFDKKATETEV